MGEKILRKRKIFLRNGKCIKKLDDYIKANKKIKQVSKNSILQKLLKWAEKEKEKRNCMEIIKKEKMTVAGGQGINGQLFTSYLILSKQQLFPEGNMK